jgi:hypothetical protein
MSHGTAPSFCSRGRRGAPHAQRPSAQRACRERRRRGSARRSRTAPEQCSASLRYTHGTHGTRNTLHPVATRYTPVAIRVLEQHAATGCSALQHEAARRNALQLQPVATHGGILHHRKPDATRNRGTSLPELNQTQGRVYAEVHRIGAVGRCGVLAQALAHSLMLWGRGRWVLRRRHLRGGVRCIQTGCGCGRWAGRGCLHG